MGTETIYKRESFLWIIFISIASFYLISMERGLVVLIVFIVYMTIEYFNRPVIDVEYKVPILNQRSGRKYETN